MENTAATIQKLLEHVATKPHALCQACEEYTCEWEDKSTEQFDGELEWQLVFPIYSDDFICNYSPSWGLLIHTPPERKNELIDSFAFAEDGPMGFSVNFSQIDDIDSVYKLLDEAYERIWNDIPRTQRRFIECKGQPEDLNGLIDEWIDQFGLQDQRQKIQGLGEVSALFRTSLKESETEKIGQSRIGGSPDLLPQTSWPKYKNGQPFTFLAQIDLSQLYRIGFRMTGLPDSGLLSVFSAWGWQDEGYYDPAVSDWDCENDESFNCIVHTPENQRSELVRIETPSNVNSFLPIALDPILFLSFPRYGEAVSDFDSTDSMYFDMANDYEYCYQKYFNLDGFHQMGGFRMFPHADPDLMMPEVLVGKSHRLILKVDSNDLTEMSFGDCGALSFHTFSLNSDNLLNEPVYCAYD